MDKYLSKHPNVMGYCDNHAYFSNSAIHWVLRKLVYGIPSKYCTHEMDPYATKFYGVLPARVDFLKNVYGLPAEKCELLVMGADDDLVDATLKTEIRSEMRTKYNIADGDFLIMTGVKIDAFKTHTLLLMDVIKRINNLKL